MVTQENSWKAAMKREKLLKKMIVPEGGKINLRRDYATNLRIVGDDKEEQAKELNASVHRLAQLQDRMYAQDRQALLVILQALDAAGKDGTIKHVMSGLNPQGVQVTSFKAPSAEERDHDYLWRCVKALPERGRIGIFNRSYYEEVLVVRVHPEILAGQPLPDRVKGNKKIWKQRFAQITNFEDYLFENGIQVVKIFLNVSKEEQKRRFLARIDTPDRNWKFSSADVSERAHFDEYLDAFEDCFRHTSTERAPWYVVPADHKPSMRLAVAQIVEAHMERLDLVYPELDKAHLAELQKAKELLEQEPA